MGEGVRDSLRGEGEGLTGKEKEEKIKESMVTAKEGAGRREKHYGEEELRQVGRKGDDAEEGGSLEKGLGKQ